MIESKVKVKRRVALLISSVILLICIILNLMTGEYRMTFQQVWQTLLGFGDSASQLILVEFRLPRLMITLFAGIALSLSGAILQGVTRNALAEPGILGINAGSGFAIALFIAIGQIKADDFVYMLPLVSLIGGLVVTLFLFYFSYEGKKGLSPESMVLVGIGLSAALSGGALTLVSSFDKSQSEFISAWLAGNIWGDTWPFVWAFLPWLVIIIPVILYKAETLNILNTDDTIAVALGVSLNRQRVILVLAAILLSSVAVSVAGAIGFIGLMGPHIARSIIGPRHQSFLPLAMIIGGILLVVSDNIGQVLLQPNGLPAGVIAAIIGAPYFLYLMYRVRQF
ncbi:FecCD family ABC transporter permease [Staphylococcus ratti]|uniref:Iron ABC transporter permease n=1 Tax=Staphylococcus ratti TaxID=2892440 RepID=A0ABY3PBZ1_9STAP|nr:iron ABC transporter permease [Staphylococcus ratti]UEX89829.1 iron ABC transporter permease [Staphylococcus ratti]